MTHVEGMAVLQALNADPELRAICAAPPPACPRGATLAGLGVPYRLAGRDVPPPTLAAVAVLGLLRSPLLAGAEEIQPMDAYRALWALTASASDLAPLHGLDARIAALARYGSAVGLSGEQVAKAQAEVTAAAFAPVDRQALEVATRYPSATPQEVADVVQRMVADVTGAWGLVPRGGGGNGGDPTPSTATGWAACLPWLRRLAWRCALATCGRLLRRGWAS